MKKLPSLLAVLVLAGAGCTPSVAPTPDTAPVAPVGDHDTGAPEDFELQFHNLISVNDNTPFALKAGETGKITLDFGGGTGTYFITAKSVDAKTSSISIVMDGETAKQFTLSTSSPTAMYNGLEVRLQSSTASSVTLTAKEGHR